ncbi:MAG TPA: DUF6152 family protein [Gammaproteobacteria bacterium]|nr:DUF6152 family protein [Gammaproteobacteria bacterium]
MFRSARRAVALCGAFAIGGAVHAHHGFGNFDSSADLMTLTGVVTGVEFINPHSWVYFTVTDEAAEEQHWRCELRAATVLTRSGWTPEMFVNGETITVLALPDRSDPRSCYLSNITFEDGTSYNRYAQIDESTEPEELTFDEGERPLRLANGELNISGDWAPVQMLLTDPRVGGIPREEQPENARGPGGGGPRAEPVAMTEAGQAAVDAIDFRSPEGNPRFRCETTSVIFDWPWDGSTNRIVQRGDTISLIYGQHGFTRTIHMHLDAHPADIEPSRAGHSIGRWEDGVLVVDTVGFLPGLLTGQILHSGELHVVERFSLDAEMSTLTREYTAEDPLYFVGQHTGSDTLYVADLPHAVHPCRELMNIDFSVEGQ